MRKFTIDLNEWYDKDSSDNSKIGRNIKIITYEQKEGKQNTIGDLKNWLFWHGLENNEDLCPCFLTIDKYNHYNNKKKRDILKKCDYNDNTLLDDTEFNENNRMYVSFDKSRKCTCGKMNDMKGIKNIFSNKLEQEKKNLQDDFNRKNDDTTRKYENKLNQVTNQFNIKIQEQTKINNELKREMKRKNIEYEEQIKWMKLQNEEKNRKNEEKIKILDQSLIEIKKKENTCVQNKISAENEYNNSYQNIFSNYYTNEKTPLIQEITKEMEIFLLNKLSFDDLVEEIIPKIAKEEKFSKNIREFMEDKIDAIKDENLTIKISHFNILIMGNTGVGKSTLLNKVLKDQLAKTGFGSACTQGKPKPYESNNAKGIRIWDTKGIEQGIYNINAANLDIENAIDNLVKENDPDKFIHCIWYCVHSNRFLNEEIENIKKCYNYYIKNLPIIIIYTQSDNQEDADKMIKYIKGEIESIKNEDDENIKILKVLAEDKKIDNGIIKAFGISNLMKETSEIVKKGIESSCIESLMKQGENILKEEFKENINNIKNELFNENLIMDLPNLNDNDQFNILNELIKKEDESIAIFEKLDFVNFTKFVSHFSKKLAIALMHKNMLEKPSLKDILSIMMIKANDIKNHFEEIFDKKSNDASNLLADKIDNLTHELDSTYNISYLSFKYGHNNLKIQSKNNITNNLKPEIEDQVYREMSKKLYDIYAEKFSEKLQEIFHELLNGDKSNKKLEDIFFDKGHETAEKIYNKIVNLLDYPNDDYVEKKKKGKSIKERMNQRNKGPKDGKEEKNEGEEEEEEEDEEEKKDKKEKDLKENNKK